MRPAGRIFFVNPVVAGPKKLIVSHVVWLGDESP